MNIVSCQLSYSWFQTSQTGGQQYSDTSPFSIPCINYGLLSNLKILLPKVIYNIDCSLVLPAAVSLVLVE